MRRSTGIQPLPLPPESPRGDCLPLLSAGGLAPDDFLAETPKRRRRSQSVHPLEAAKLDALSRSKSGDWAGAGGDTLVGLYALCHSSVYKVDASELEGRSEFSAAKGAAQRLLAQRFCGDAGECAELVRWCWEREKRKVEWMAAQGHPLGKRLGWRFVFSAVRYADWRAAVANGGRR